MTTIAVTGHRPEKLPDPGWVRDALYEALIALDPDLLIVGMAAGVDLWAGEIALDVDIPVAAYRPWAGHRARVADRLAYRKVQEGSVMVIDCHASQEYPGPWVYQLRNERMVDDADAVLAVWNGDGTGGTVNCVRYARKRGKHVHRIDPSQMTVLDRRFR